MKQNIYDIVKQILTDYPQTRNSDKEMIWAVYRKLGYTSEYVINKNDFMKAPAAESITRARRKVQEQHPLLQATKIVRGLREEKEKTKGVFVYNETAGSQVLLLDDEGANT